MRLVFLCLLLLGASAILRHHQGGSLAPSFLQSVEEPIHDPISCQYEERVDEDLARRYCGFHCTPSDHVARYPVYHVSQDSENCPVYTTWELCSGTTRCAPEDWPEECQATWSDWTPCSASCGGGQQERVRTLAFKCLSCDYCDHEYKSCNTQACGRDCTVDSAWSDWSECSVSCIPFNPVVAIKTRSRSITQGVVPGRICEQKEYFETASCADEVPQCAVDCVVSEWSSWSDCSKTCGCGVQSRTRDVITYNNAYGTPCPHLTQQKSCACPECPQKCEYSEWSVSGCSGDCYYKVPLDDGTYYLEYPQRRITRYILKEAKGGEPTCNYPCEMAKTEPCKDVPECPSDCVVTGWGNWTGECPKCLAPGQPVPVLVRERSIISAGTGICGCTREEQVCDVPWCCEDCLVSDWSDWGPCIPNSPCSGGSQSGVRTRSRDVVRPRHICGQACPDLEEEQPCDLCCPQDCEVGAWNAWSNGCAKFENGQYVPMTCGTTPGIIKYTRSVTKQPNSCGAPCPDTEKTVSCLPPKSCCPVNCTLGEPEYSDCYGCGSNARRWKKTVVINYESCGGVSCCYESGSCALLKPVSCNPVPPCPETPCVFSEWGNYSACSASCGTGQTCRSRYLVSGEPERCPGELKDCVPCNTQCCPVNCEVGEWQGWSAWQPSCGLQVRDRARPITQGASCTGSPCPPTVEHDTQYTCCPRDCVVEEWGSWSLCPTCVPAGETPQKSSRSRAILVQPSCGGANCPTVLYQERDCPNVGCDVPCIVSEWGEWGDCSIQAPFCGDGYQTKSRTIVRAQSGFGTACPPLTETKYCKVECNNCVLGPIEYGPCSPTCTTQPGKMGTRKVLRGNKPLVIEYPNGTKVEMQMCPWNATIEECPIPCCPVDCVMDKWSEWSPCVDGVKTRTRTVKEYARCGGAPCPVCLLERDECTSPPIPGECEIGGACEEGISEEY